MYDRGWKFGQLHWSEILGIRLREKKKKLLLVRNATTTTTNIYQS